MAVAAGVLVVLDVGVVPAPALVDPPPHAASSITMLNANMHNRTGLRHFFAGEIS